MRILFQLSVALLCSIEYHTTFGLFDLKYSCSIILLSCNCYLVSDIVVVGLYVQFSLDQIK